MDGQSEQNRATTRMVGAIHLQIHVIARIHMTMVTSAPLNAVYRDVCRRALLIVTALRAYAYVILDIGDPIVSFSTVQTPVMQMDHVIGILEFVPALKGSSGKTAHRYAVLMTVTIMAGVWLESASATHKTSVMTVLVQIVLGTVVS